MAEKIVSMGNMHAVPAHWVLVLRMHEQAPEQPHTTPRKVPTTVRFPWDR